MGADIILEVVYNVLEKRQIVGKFAKFLWCFAGNLYFCTCRLSVGSVIEEEHNGPGVFEFILCHRWKASLPTSSPSLKPNDIMLNTLGEKYERRGKDYKWFARARARYFLEAHNVIARDQLCPRSRPPCGVSAAFRTSIWGGKKD
jgi:hypothetical protein